MILRGLLKPFLILGLGAIQIVPAHASHPECRGMVAATHAIAALYLQNPGQPPSLRAALDALHPHRVDLSQDQKMALLSDVYKNFQVQKLPHDQQMLFNNFTSEFLKDATQTSAWVVEAAKTPQPEKPKPVSRATLQMSALDLSRKLDSITEPTLIFLTTPGCPYCERMKKEWEAEATQELAQGKKAARMIVVELGEDEGSRQLLSKRPLNQFDGFPAFVMIAAGGRMTASQGARDGKVKELLSRIEN